MLAFADIADFVIDNVGRQVICCNARAGVSLKTIRHLLIDQVLPLVVNLRGREALHATAVATRRGSVHSQGLQGRGNLTSPPASSSRAIRWSALIASRFPRRAYPDAPRLSGLAAVERFGKGAWRKLTEAEGGCALHNKIALNGFRRGDFCSTSRRLARIYLFQRTRAGKRAARVLIEELAPMEALMGLIRQPTGSIQRTLQC